MTSIRHWPGSPATEFAAVPDDARRHGDTRCGNARHSRRPGTCRLAWRCRRRDRTWTRGWRQVAGSANCRGLRRGRQHRNRDSSRVGPDDRRCRRRRPSAGLPARCRPGRRAPHRWHQTPGQLWCPCPRGRRRRRHCLRYRGVCGCTCLTLAHHDRRGRGWRRAHHRLGFPPDRGSRPGPRGASQASAVKLPDAYRGQYRAGRLVPAPTIGSRQTFLNRH
jgi:hypothetical protein